MTTTRQVLAIAAVAAASLFSAGAALAQEATPDTWLQVQSTKSRADVGAELFAARQAGLTKAWSAGYMEPVRNSATSADAATGLRPTVSTTSSTRATSSCPSTMSHCA